MTDPDQRSDLAEVLARQAATQDGARSEAVAKRHERGGRTARENVFDLIDDGSFVEYGALAIAAQRMRRSAEELIEKTPADGLGRRLHRPLPPRTRAPHGETARRSAPSTTGELLGERSER